MNHLNTNMLIVHAIVDYMTAHPELRFQQVLQDMNIVKHDGTTIVDSFYETSEDTLRGIEMH